MSASPLFLLDRGRMRLFLDNPAFLCTGQRCEALRTGQRLLALAQADANGDTDTQPLGVDAPALAVLARGVYSAGWNFPHAGQLAR